ncbi:hypothetical protein P171DRAFT_124327 [Karstenula rhodostoma CBS 690.94]|uniref:Uncharacterized protein n=1 Tax=Karstenula rhodostoma CBS 690.94 TaxID=1392251 RepID=A0A9P4P912_9PLEO|nr:hypothetical protein P171DRAFT_124327 [Karstenula rhodostoma CBS 690.94]
MFIHFLGVWGVHRLEFVSLFLQLHSIALGASMAINGRSYFVFRDTTSSHSHFRGYKPDHICSPLTKALPYGHGLRHSRGTWPWRDAQCATWRLCGSAIETKRDSAVLLSRPQRPVPAVQGGSRLRVSVYYTVNVRVHVCCCFRPEKRCRRTRKRTRIPCVALRYAESDLVVSIRFGGPSLVGVGNRWVLGEDAAEHRL